MKSEVATIHVFIGTKAQYIKTAPVIWELERRGIPYRLIDSGQHGSFSRELREELGIREPDYRFGDDRDVASILAALFWSLRVLSFIFNKRLLRGEVFPNGQICVVHGDTPSTFLSTLLARRAGLEVAHLEAGLRSFSYLNPFPEELIRVIVMKMSQILFAPSEEAEENLRAMKLKGEIVRVSGNTVIEALGDEKAGAGTARPVVTIHRVENLHRSSRLRKLLETVRDISREREILFVLHPPTEEAIAKNDLGHMLEQRSIETVSLLPHNEFVAHLREAPFVITDGGSIQEECALIGVPTLLWREHTERSDGIGDNVVLSRFDDQIISSFLSDTERFRKDEAVLTLRPSAQIVDRLLEGVPTS